MATVEANVFDSFATQPINGPLDNALPAFVFDRCETKLSDISIQQTLRRDSGCLLASISRT